MNSNLVLSKVLRLVPVPAPSSVEEMVVRLWGRKGYNRLIPELYHPDELGIGAPVDIYLFELGADMSTRKAVRKLLSAGMRLVQPAHVFALAEQYPHEQFDGDIVCLGAGKEGLIPWLCGYFRLFSPRSRDRYCRGQRQQYKKLKKGWRVMAVAGKEF